MFDAERLISDRARAIDASGIRRIFALAAGRTDIINLSIGQPDFDVPQALTIAAADALAAGRNGYSQSQGAPGLLRACTHWLAEDLGWNASPAGDAGDAPARCMITSGTSGALTLAFLALLGPGDEAIIPDPGFVSYPHLATMAGARAVRCDTYPDFRMTAERVAPFITERTKFVLVNSPSNPCGVVLSVDECRELRALCRERGVLLISDEIYDEFTFAEAETDFMLGGDRHPRCPSPCRDPEAVEDTLLIRGFGKTYGCTGWRHGYAAGPRAVIEQMAKLHQYTYVCAPTPLQAGVEAAFDVDMGPTVERFAARRDIMLDALSPVTEVVRPSGAFYVFARVPEKLGLTGSAFVERCIERGLLLVPGGVFSSHDTHVRISMAADEDTICRGMDVLVELMTA